MEKDKITQLLEKYWNAETTPEEEKLIKFHLKAQQTGDVESRKWFEAIQAYQVMEPPLEPDFKAAEAVRFPPRSKSFSWLNIAASLLVILGISWLYINNQHTKSAAQDEAMRRNAEAGLMRMSEALNEGYRQLNQSTILLQQSK